MHNGNDLPLAGVHRSAHECIYSTIELELWSIVDDHVCWPGT